MNPPQDNLKKEIKLNHPCKICNKVIFIEDMCCYKGRFYHIECFLEQAKSKTLKKVFKEIKILKKQTEDSNFKEEHKISIFVFIKELTQKLKDLEMKG